MDYLIKYNEVNILKMNKLIIQFLNIYNIFTI